MLYDRVDVNTCGTLMMIIIIMLIITTTVLYKIQLRREIIIIIIVGIHDDDHSHHRAGISGCGRPLTKRTTRRNKGIYYNNNII